MVLNTFNRTRDTDNDKFPYEIIFPREAIQRKPTACTYVDRNTDGARVLRVEYQRSNPFECSLRLKRCRARSCTTSGARENDVRVSIGTNSRIWNDAFGSYSKIVCVEIVTTTYVLKSEDRGIR